MQLDFSKGTSRTNPEFQKECDIHNIIKLPLPEQVELAYGDITETPTLRDVFKTVHDVRSNFMKLPSDIRKLMDNDPSLMRQFITDPKNKELLMDRGIIKRPKQKPVEKTEKTNDNKEVAKPSKG